MSIGSLVLAVLSATGLSLLWAQRAKDPPSDWPLPPGDAAGAVADELERETDFLARHPQVGVVFSDLEKYDGTRFTPSFMRSTEVFSPRLGEGGPAEFVLRAREMFQSMLEEAVVKTPALTVRRPLLQSVGGFDERWSSSEDWELLLRLALATPFGYIDRPLAVIRISPDSLHRVDQARGDQLMLELL